MDSLREQGIFLVVAHKHVESDQPEVVSFLGNGLATLRTAIVIRSKRRWMLGSSLECFPTRVIKTKVNASACVFSLSYSYPELVLCCRRSLGRPRARTPTSHGYSWCLCRSCHSAQMDRWQRTPPEASLEQSFQSSCAPPLGPNEFREFGSAPPHCRRCNRAASSMVVEL